MDWQLPCKGCLASVSGYLLQDGTIQAAWIYHCQECQYRYAPRLELMDCRVSPLHHLTGSTSSSEWPHTIYASNRITDRKSVFLAHASTLPNPSSFPLFLAHLTALPALKRATHCMYAYRTSNPVTSQPVLGQNDGGESGSGDKLARLLELAGCENTVVVVSRWYGGVQLGSDRWRLISGVANEALDHGGFKRPKQQLNDTKKKLSSRKRK